MVFDVFIAGWMFACLLWLAARIPAARRASTGDGPAATIGTMKLRSQLVTGAIVSAVLLVHLAQMVGLVSYRVEAEVFAVALASAATFQICAKELARRLLMKEVDGEARPRFDPPPTFRIVEGGARDGAGPDGEEGPALEDDSGQP